MAAAAAALPDFTEAQIRALSSRQAEPGLDALFKAARREAQRVNRRPPTREQVRDAVVAVSTRRVFGRRPHAGTAAAAAVGEKLQCDLVSVQALETTKGNRGYKFVLLCIDVASRKPRGTALQGNDAPTMRVAFERLFQSGTPKIVDSDAGGEFKAPEVTALTQERGVAQQFKDPQDRGGIALIDRASGQFKQAMYKLLQSNNASAFYDKVDDILRALNERPSEVLGGAQPNDVAGNDHLKHLIMTRNTALMERNQAAFVRMSRGLEVGSLPRAPLPRKQRGFQRGAALQFSADVHRVAAVLQSGRQVRAEDGKFYSTKLVLPVAAGSQAAGRALEQAAARRTAQVRGQRGGQG